MKRVARSYIISTGAMLVVAIALYVAYAAPQADGEPAPANRASQEPVRSTDAAPRLIVDARLAPYSAIGKFKGTKTCTAGVVLHPRIIVTAGHCVVDKDGRIRPSKLFSFRPGYQTGTDLGRFEATVWAVGSTRQVQRQTPHDAARDWAILVLDRATAGIRPFPLSNHTSEGLRSPERQVILPSYSSDVLGADILAVDPGCSVTNMAWEMLVHDCKAQFGSSGAPLLARHRDGYALVGIHTGAMLVSDNENGMKSIGNSAVGAWIFADALHTLAQRLNGDQDIRVANALNH